MAAPRRPEPDPLPTNDLKVVVIGTVLWAAALVLALAFRDRLDSQGRDAWVWVAVAGLALGLVGIHHLRRRRTRSSEASDPSGSRSAPKES